MPDAVMAGEVAAAVTAPLPLDVAPAVVDAVAGVEHPRLLQVPCCLRTAASRRH